MIRIYCKNLFYFVFYIFFFLNFSCVYGSSTFISKLNKCAVCHTSSGNSTTVIWPKIAGQHYDYIIKQLFDMKKGKDGGRFDSTMFGMLQGLNEKDLNDLALYFSKQILEENKRKNINNEQFNLGRNIYFNGDRENKITGCFGCHGMDGLGNSLAKYPILKSQHKEYLIIQMKKFQSNDRLNDVNGIMRDITVNMSSNQIDAVAAYISHMN